MSASKATGALSSPTVLVYIGINKPNKQMTAIEALKQARKMKDAAVWCNEENGIPHLRYRFGHWDRAAYGEVLELSDLINILLSDSKKWEVLSWDQYIHGNSL